MAPLIKQTHNDLYPTRFADFIASIFNLQT